MPIPLVALQVQPTNIGGAFAEGRQAAQRNALIDMQMQAQRRKAEQENALASFYQQQGPNLLAGDEGALSGLSRIDPSGAIDLRGQSSEAEKKRLEAVSSKLGLVAQGANAVLNAGDGADKQSLWSGIRNNLITTYGIPADQLPDIWDDNEAYATVQQAMTLKDQIDQSKDLRDFRQRAFEASPVQQGRVAASQAAARQPYELEQAATRQMEPPSGYMRGPQGLQFQPGGPADPDVIRRNAEAGAAARREVIINNPLPTQQPGGKPMPVGVQRQEDDDLAAVSIASNIENDLGAFAQQIKDGTLKIGPVSNTVSDVRLALGQGTEADRNYSTFRAELERLRNESLRLNKGVQTEGDSQRAWNELFRNIRDQGAVMQRLGEIQGINARAALLKKQQIDIRRQRNRAEPFDWTGFEIPGSPYGNNEQGQEAPAAAPGELPRVQNDADYAKLKSGDKFIDPSGNTRTKR